VSAGVYCLIRRPPVPAAGPRRSGWRWPWERWRTDWRRELSELCEALELRGRIKIQLDRFPRRLHYWLERERDLRSAGTPDSW